MQKDKLYGTLEGVDGNIYAIFAYFKIQALKQGRTPEYVKEVIERAKATDDYYRAIGVIDAEFYSDWGMLNEGD